MRLIWLFGARCLALPLLVLAAMLAAPGSGMALGVERAKSHVDHLGAAAVAILRDEALDRAEREKALADLVRESFALDRVARLALGRHWRAAEPAEQTAYVELFERYVLGTYARLIDFYTDQTLDVTGVSEASNALIVHSRLLGERRAQIDWRVVEEDGTLKVVDVVIEGVSMLVTQRNEFAAIIERGGGIAALLRHLEARLRALDSAPG